MRKLKEMTTTAVKEAPETKSLADKIKTLIKSAQSFVTGEGEPEKKFPKATPYKLAFEFPLGLEVPIYSQLLPKNVFGQYIPPKCSLRGVDGPAILISKTILKRLKKNKFDTSALMTVFHELGHHWQDTQYDKMGTMNLNEPDLVKRYINYTSKERVINQHAKMIVDNFYKNESWAPDVIKLLNKIIKCRTFEYRVDDSIVIIRKTRLGFIGKTISNEEVKTAIIASMAEAIADKENGTDEEDAG